MPQERRKGSVVIAREKIASHGCRNLKAHRMTSVYAQFSPAETATPLDRPVAIGVVVIHGVMPQPRYGIQDLAARNLRLALKKDVQWGACGDWTSRVTNLKDQGVAQTLIPDPTISRVQIGDAEAPPPQTPYFDVIESYWSPLDKGKTTFALVSSWILQTLFVPLNTTARYASPAVKTFYDFGLIVGGVAVVVALLIGAFVCAMTALNGLILKAGTCVSVCPTVWEILTDPVSLTQVFSWWTLGVLAIAAIGAFLIAQAVKAGLSAIGQKSELQLHAAQRSDRWWLILIAFLVGALLLTASALVPILPQGAAGGWLPLWFVVAALLVVGAKTLAQSWVVNFFGDVQIYTTRNENSEFFAMREAILECVAKTIVDACCDAANEGKGYDRVFVLAHSLGSTIAMDALLRFFEATEQAPELKAALRRMRGFVTFGTSLEKTRYFFDVNDPSPSLALEQWNDDLYGALFTPDVRELHEPNDSAEGIFWLNDWYFTDAVCNAIDSYRSFLRPGTSLSEAPRARAAVVAAARKQGVGDIVCPIVALNQQGSKGFVFPEIIPHSAYLEDPWFWASEGSHIGVLDVLASSCPAVWPRFTKVAEPSYERVEAGRFQRADTDLMRRFADHYKLS
jgi:hypothetical protein